MGRFADTPYQNRTDAEKAETQWRKALGLLNRRDWSAAIVRAVTAIEISLNLAIRAEHEARHDMPVEEVDRRLLRANGVARKLSMLEELLDDVGKAKVRALGLMTRDATDKRNRIVHSGEFCDEEDARAHVESCRAFVNSLISGYDLNFELAIEEIAPQVDPGA